jgi:hypothetical protein
MWVGGGLLVVFAALAITVDVLAHRAEPYLRAQIVDYLQQKFHARVELDTFHISLRHGLHGQWGVLAQGSGLRIWPSADAESRRQLEGPDSGAPDAPLIRLQSFQFHAPLRFERGKPIVISVVQIQGLDIDVPPRKHATGKTSAGGVSTPNGNAASEPSTDASQQPDNNVASQKSKPSGVLSDVVVDRIECDQATLLLETDKPGKVPLGFAIAHLSLTNVTADGPMKFDANLTNPRPQGNIHTTGSFGPWQSSDPGESAVSGDYQFDHADLGDFKGIAGILSSTGQYQGTLRNIVVDGVTDTPDFQLTLAGNPMPLHTKFHAIVDGTDGDTWLQPVDATLGKSHFTAQGQIVRLKIPQTPSGKSSAPELKDASLQSPSPTQAVLRPQGGLDILLAINVDRARIEDFLHLAMRGSAPVLTGDVKVKATLHIPSGKTPIPQRMTLKGKFFLYQVQFSSPKIQGGIEQLSLRGQGRPKELKKTDPATVDSTMQSDFQMANGIITLPGLIYTVPGATINVAGTYGVVDGALDFKGNIKMDATVSQMVGGWKGLLLKPADRFFKKNGAGTELPIHIDGTREHPGFGVDFNRMKGTSAEIPGQQAADPQKPAQPDDKQPATQ